MSNPRVSTFALIGAAVCGFVAVVLLQLAPHSLWLWLGLDTAAIALGIVAIASGIIRENNRKISCGLLSATAGFILLFWIWGTQIFLYTDDPVRACSSTTETASVNGKLSFSESVVPPALFCFIDGPESEMFLGTPLMTVIAWSTFLLLLLGALITAIFLNRAPQDFQK